MLRPFSVEQSATYSVDSVAQRIIDWAIIMLLAKFGVSLVIYVTAHAKMSRLSAHFITSCEPQLHCTDILFLI